MIPYLTEQFGNPASQPQLWLDGRRSGRECAGRSGQAFECRPQGNCLDLRCTESDNLAIKGAAQFYKSKGKHIITVKTEHKAVLDTCRELERQGFE
jgi:cysteine desulfurase